MNKSGTQELLQTGKDLRCTCAIALGMMPLFPDALSLVSGPACMQQNNIIQTVNSILIVGCAGVCPKDGVIATDIT